MLAADLIATLRLDVGDAAADILGDARLARCLARGVYAFNADVGPAYTLDGTEVLPDPTPEDQALVLLAAHVAACVLMRSIAANNFSFSSGDKQVDKTKQADFWAELQRDLEREYAARLKARNPDAAFGDGDGVMAAPAVRPAVFERGIEEDPDAPLK